MRLLDLFAGAGGAGEGYRQAGFEVTGVEKFPRRCGYPCGQLMVADAMEVVADATFLRQFDLVHASPPCQVFTRARNLRDAQGKATAKVNLIGAVRAALVAAGVPYVIENVEGAPLRADLRLCGSFFAETAQIQRHRVFELSGVDIPFQPTCRHRPGRRLRTVARERPVGVYHKLGDDIPHGGRTAESLEQARAVMGISWMSFDALAEAIPPAYTRYIGGMVIARAHSSAKNQPIRSSSI